ncbi:ABC transporter C-terminal domain-containing protein [Mesorhizobium sp. L-8-3]|uniref:ABC transporter C-terminal domain-containing protein n=1 Tax=Mesorhizobium sp. L-8-3 TaxID=2744522 RepID=UPI00192912FA|nr:ABC transporter C-terminal domain-containing protein [Mesorhizobium sp. L-8-3]BCH22477.1 hypothetical protein MesoLjLb_22620 [Mesorhizobium sp. L-8-3]
MPSIFSADWRNEVNAELAGKQPLLGSSSSMAIAQATIGTGAYGSYNGAPVSALVPGSTFGALIEGASVGHLVLGIRDNDVNDSVSIVSCDGTGAYSRLVAAFRASGVVVVPSTLMVGTVSTTGASYGKDISATAIRSSRTETSTVQHAQFYNPNGLVGSIHTNASATAYNTSSDDRLKDFLGTFDPVEAMAVIRADPTCKFAWKVDGSVAVGWGAQSSYTISPDLASPGVGDPGDDDYIPWGMDLSKRTPYLWAVIPWLADRLEAAEAKIAALEARIAALEAA